MAKIGEKLWKIYKRQRFKCRFSWHCRVPGFL